MFPLIFKLDISIITSHKNSYISKMTHPIDYPDAIYEKKNTSLLNTIFRVAQGFSKVAPRFKVASGFLEHDCHSIKDFFFSYSDKNVSPSK